MSSEPKNKRRRLQISLRAVLLFVALACIGFAWLGLKLQHAREQRAMINSLRSLKGEVGPKVETKVTGPEWARSVFGDDLFTHVVQIEVNGPTDAMLAPLDRCKHLQTLTIVNAPVTDITLARIRGLTKLRSLSLRKTKITDAGLENLAGLANLENLGLGQTPLTDAALVYLRRLTKLRSIDLSDTKITDAALMHLHELTELANLDFNNTPITDAGVEWLCQLPNVAYLNLDDTQIGDCGVAMLCTMPHLKWVSIRRTKITKAAHDYLRKATQIEEASADGFGLHRPRRQPPLHIRDW